MAPQVTLEFFGIPRLRAGRPHLTVAAATVGAALAAAVRDCPGLAGLLGADGRLDRHYLLSRDGREFLTDPARPLADGDRLVLLSADVGG
jgi:molybdopterin converting factor small subunit